MGNYIPCRNELDLTRSIRIQIENSNEFSNLKVTLDTLVKSNENRQSVVPPKGKLYPLFIASFHRLDLDLRLFILSALVGVVGGLSAIFLRYGTYFVYMILIELPYTFLKAIVPLQVSLFLSLCLGAVLVSVISQRFPVGIKGHGVPLMINAVENHHSKFTRGFPVLSLVKSSLTIGSGGSAGREGPIVQIAGGFGSNIGQMMKVTPKERKYLVFAGIAAGISASFNAPIGGVLFAAEVFKRENEYPPLIPLITSSVIGNAIGVLFLGPSFAFRFTDTLSGRSQMEIPLFIIVGILLGILSTVWIVGFARTGIFFARFNRPLLTAIAGALIVAIVYVTIITINAVGFLGFSLPLPIWVEAPPGFPDLILQNSVYAINTIFDQKMAFWAAIILFVSAGVLNAITLGAGGAGGQLTPTIFMGATIGNATGLLFIGVGFSDVNVPLLAVLGMSAFFAGVFRTPLTAIILVSEMIGDFLLIIPLMFAVAAAWIVSKEIHSDNMFLSSMKAHGISVPRPTTEFLEETAVKDIMVTKVITVCPKDRLEHVLHLMDETGHSGFPVIEEGLLVGIITEKDVSRAVKTQSDVQNWVVGNFCTKEIISVLPDCPVSTAITLMANRNINRLPVVDEIVPRRLLGILTRSDILKAQLAQAIRQAQERHEEELFEEDYVAELASARGGRV